MAPHLAPFVVPIGAVILLALFAIQYRGTERVGRMFGPVMAIRFLVMAALGVNAILQTPDVLWAVDPRFAQTLLVTHQGVALTILGDVVLSVTGVEAPYADMGHFGRPAIRTA